MFPSPDVLIQCSLMTFVHSPDSRSGACVRDSGETVVTSQTRGECVTIVTNEVDVGTGYKSSDEHLAASEKYPNEQSI